MDLMKASETVLRSLDFLRRRKQDYQAVFMSPAGQRVLTDLARYCRANESCFHADPRIHAVAEGQRRVWLRIQQHLNLTSQELYDLYRGNTPLKPGGTTDG